MAGRIQTTASDLKSNPMFSRMLESAYKQGKGDPTIGVSTPIVGIDPGETTGFAYHLPWKPLHTLSVHQLATKSIKEGIEAVEAAWPETAMKCIVVIEDYKVYSWKATDHAWNNLHTAKFIGALELWCLQKGHQIVYQMAGQAKAWATDDKLKLWGLYEPGLRHGRDATRYIINYLFFGKRPKGEITEAEMDAKQWER